MAFYLFVALFLSCAGITMVSVVYFCSLWYVAANRDDADDDVEAAKNSRRKGLSVTQIENLPRVTGKELATVKDCVVCLEEIGCGDEVRLIPGCNHGFHLQCADAWLSDHPDCPLCRAKLQPQTNV